ncbi:CorA Mg2+ and Co2+ transporter [Pyrenophora tritici-repentis]|nr:CorA Mg2+ and Co2+ transporter [Pyrenophora tritici-repentis]KAI1559394.1 CorA Mg2+ and Co2+ transporter [Pyrenophora tritici-repentis]
MNRHSKNVEWFLVYLIAELGTTPHNIRQSYSIPSLMDAYDTIAHELKQRRYDRWQRNETIHLVRAYLVCIDELTVLGKIFSKKLDFSKRLQLDCDFLEQQDKAAGVQTVDNPEGETETERIAFAQHMMEDLRITCTRLTVDLRESLNSLFQLRSIEQNKLAIIADTQNKAIFVLTGFTIVFLPLSFFTSYFGMNLKGIIDTDRTEEYYWKVYGSVAFGIVLLVCLYAFRWRIWQRVWRWRTRREVWAV